MRKYGEFLSLLCKGKISYTMVYLRVHKYSQVGLGITKVTMYHKRIIRA